MAQLSVRGRRWFCVLTALVLVACSGDWNAPFGGAGTIFSDLALVGSALHYPSEVTDLERCKTAKREACLRVYGRIKNAQDRLFSYPHAQALRMTLDTVMRDCSAQAFPEGEHVDATSRCRGALVALYFFTSTTDDAAIQGFLAAAPDVVVRRACEVDSKWLFVRKDKAAWRRWLATASLSEENKALLLRTLAIPIREGLTLERL